MRYDFIIVGGGLVGAGLAAALHSSWKVALVDASLPNNADPRLFALNFSSCQFLKNIGLWPALSANAAPIHQVHVSNQGRFGAVRLNGAEVGLSSLGHVIPALHIETALNERLANLPNVTLYRPAKLLTLDQTADDVVLTLEMGNVNTTLHASYVIGADGTESTVRKQLNIPIDVVDYAQCAIVTRTTLQRSHHQIAYERFNQRGAIAMLPLVGDECATIWTIDKAAAQTLMTLSDAAFLQALQKEFGYRLGRLQAISQRHTFNLQKVLAEKNWINRVLLLGNSAHTVSPIAAQGFNLALYEVAVVVEQLSKPFVDLAEIATQLKAQQTASISLSHQLTQLFSSKSVLLNGMLSLGMTGFDSAPFIKKKFISKMLGRSGQVPSLLLSANEC